MTLVSKAALLLLVLLLAPFTASCKSETSEAGVRQANAALVEELEDIAAEETEDAAEKFTTAVTRKVEPGYLAYEKILSDETYAWHLEIISGILIASVELRAAWEAVPAKALTRIQAQGLSAKEQQVVHAEYMRGFARVQSSRFALMDARIAYCKTAERLVLFLKERHGAWRLVDGVPTVETGAEDAKLKKMLTRLAADDVLVIERSAGLAH